MKKYFAYSKEIAAAWIFAIASLITCIEASAQVDGKTIFENNCKSCHAIGQKVVGPDLKDVHKRRDEVWIKSFISNSTKMVAAGDEQAVAVFREYNKIPMPSFAGSIDEEGLTALVGYMKTESETPVAVVPEDHGAPEQNTASTPAFSIKDVPGPLLIAGLAAFFLLVMIVLMMAMLVAQLVPALAQTKDDNALEQSWALRWLALFAGDTRALTGKHKDVLMSDHDYDGITEFDNDLPPWWKYLFYATIIWSGFYLVYYHYTDAGQLQIEEYQTEMQAAALFQSMSEDDPNAKTDFKVITDAGALENGKKLYLQNCAACHGKEGEGTVGPNLTDEYWLHGGDVNDIYKVIKFGVPAKGMVPWNKKLSKDQMLEVSSFILSLQGTNPANAKEPQGDKAAN